MSDIRPREVYVEQLLLRLVETRPLFHSEADFQHALAWAWQHENPDAAIRLEYRIPFTDGRAYADLWVRDASGITYVELKYWSRRIEVEVAGERFSLADQGAQDLSRYDFLKDLARVERAVAAGHATRGYVIALSNDASFWTTVRPDTIDAAFRLHDGRRVGGQLSWSEAAGAGTMRGREGPLDLAGEYELTWQPYSRVADGPRGELRYLLVEARVPPRVAAG